MNKCGRWNNRMGSAGRRVLPRFFRHFSKKYMLSAITGLLVSLLYGIVWMGQYTNFTGWIISPYPYSAGNDAACKSKIIYLIVSLIFAFMEYLFSRQRYGEFNN